MDILSKDLERFLMLNRTMPVQSDPDIRVLILGVLVGTYDAVRRRETVPQSLFETLSQKLHRFEDRSGPDGDCNYLAKRPRFIMLLSLG